MSTPQFHNFDSERPIPPDQVEIVAHDLRQQMPNHKIGNYLQTKPHVLAACEYLSLLSVDGIYVGIASANMQRSPTREFLYIETLLLGEQLHDQRLSYAQCSQLFRCVYAKQGRIPALVACKTYNARTYGMIRKLATMSGARMYPTIGVDNLPELERAALELAAVVAPGHVFEPRYGIVRGGGGGVSEAFWPTQPLTRATDINEVFSQHLTPRDRMLCVIDTDDEVVQRRLFEMFVAAEPAAAPRAGT